MIKTIEQCDNCDPLVSLVSARFRGSKTLDMIEIMQRVANEVRCNEAGLVCLPLLRLKQERETPRTDPEYRLGR